MCTIKERAAPVAVWCWSRVSTVAAVFCSLPHVPNPISACGTAVVKDRPVVGATSLEPCPTAGYGRAPLASPMVLHHPRNGTW